MSATTGGHSKSGDVPHRRAGLASVCRSIERNLKTVHMWNPAAVLHVGKPSSQAVQNFCDVGICEHWKLVQREGWLSEAKLKERVDDAEFKFHASTLALWRPERRYYVWYDAGFAQTIADNEHMRAYISRLKLALWYGGYAVFERQVDQKGQSGHIFATNISGKLGLGFELHEIAIGNVSTSKTGRRCVEMLVFRRWKS